MVFLYDTASDGASEDEKILYPVVACCEIETLLQIEKEFLK